MRPELALEAMDLEMAVLDQMTALPGMHLDPTPWLLAL